MKDSTLLLLAGGAAAAYYFFVFKPAQQIEQAKAAGEGAISAVGAGIGDIWGGVSDFLSSLFPIPTVSAVLPPAQQIAGQTVVQQAAARQEAKKVAVREAQQEWQRAGGAIKNGRFVLPPPMEQKYGLSVYPPAITNIIEGLQRQGNVISSVTSVKDIAMLEKTLQQEAAIRAASPPGTRVIGHRTQAGQEIYTLKSPTGQISVVRA